MHNYRPGAPARLGIDYETAAAINPRLVYVYAGGYGSTGPASHRAVFHPIAGALAGNLRQQLGRAYPPPPDTEMDVDERARVAAILQRSNEVNPDPNAALNTATAILAGLHARERNGCGGYIETTMLGANLYANADDAIAYAGKPERPLLDAGYNGYHALYRFYDTSDGLLLLACFEDADWRALCGALGRPDIAADPDLRTHARRLSASERLAGILAPIFATRPAAEWERLLTAVDVCAVEVLHGDSADFHLNDPHVRENGFWVPVHHPALGDYYRYASAVAFSDTPGVAGPAALLGEHTRPLLAELGYDAATIAAYEAAGIVKSSTP
jgi:crotonobetainyl-CoA:carnitine CoA-transferase CaiB-like acyl-CoA transferase